MMPKRVVVLLTGMLLLLLGVAGLPALLAQDIPPTNRTIALEVLARVNSWRVSQGLFPLAENETLAQMALDQARYVYPNWTRIAAQGLYHQDASGRDPRVRGVQAYNWPFYQNADRVEIGENAAEGSVASAVGFWQGSSIHRRTALNPAYREVGVAALPVRNGYIFYIVFGARPEVLPAMLAPNANTLYLSREQSRYAATAAETRVRLFDAAGRPLGGDMPWAPTIPLPPGTSGQVTVLYTTGSAQSLDIVDLSKDIAVLEAPAQAAMPTPTSPPPTPTAPSVTPGAQATTAGAAPVAPPPAPATPTAAASGGNTLTITFTRNSLLMQNTSAVPLDVTGLEISSATGRISISNWTRVAQFNTTRFGSRDCVAVTTSGGGANTSGCRYLLSSVQFTPDRAFWRDTTVTITNNQVTVGTCDALAGQCVITWP
ncbi:MAG: CAP domain-containing protein [Pleurocapsa minor GSE-CHR-MK-17-07R]|nr:CAP domain-containing protein [Pleurocapsa minor GSE-CHR-MK 17-07R]